MIKLISLIFILITFLTGNLLLGQPIGKQMEVKKYMIVKGAPKFVLQINGLYSISALNLGGAYNSDFHSELVKRGENLGTRNGIGVSAVTKQSISSCSRIWFVQSVSFNMIQSYLVTGSKTNSDNGKSKYNCYTGGLGIEYNLSPNYSTKVYAGAEMNASIINGEMDIWMQVAGKPYNTENFRISNSFRMGFGVSSGASFMLNKNFGLNISAKYSCLNVLLRSSEGNSTDREFTLRDGDSDYPLLFAGDKNFSFFSVGAGVTFYFGIKEKSYKLN